MKGVRGLLASIKDVFTPTEKWNYMRENEGQEYSRPCMGGAAMGGKSQTQGDHAGERGGIQEDFFDCTL